MDVGRQIFVKLPTGRTLQLDVDPETTCLVLKEQIATFLTNNKDKSYFPHQQVLSFSNTMLDDPSLLSDYNIRQDSTIFVSIKQPPKDILEFDACKVCLCQAINPCALPCGHSCCKSCISPDATICPVPECKAPLNGLSRDALPPNWLANHFFDAKETKPTQMCQICAEDKIEKEATQWCESCSKAGSMEYYCDECVVQEHSNRTNRTHTRKPIEKMSPKTLTECPKHKLPRDQFCFDENVLICYRCRDEDHKPPHQTQLATDCEEQIKNELKSSVAALSDVKAFEREETDLNKDKQTKRAEIEKLEQEIVMIDTRLKFIQENTVRCTSAASVLMKSIDEYTTQDLFDSKKLETMKTRVSQTLKLLDKAIPLTRAVLKQQYSFKSTFGSSGTGPGQFSNPQGIAIEPWSGNLFLSDTGNHRIQTFQSDGKFVRVFGTKGNGDGQYDYPHAITFDRSGCLAVCDTSNNRIQVVDAQTGQMKLKFGSYGTGNGELHTPYAIATDHHGNLVVGDHGNARIQVFTAQGIWIRTFGDTGEQLKCPYGVSVDPQGNMIVSDRGKNRLHVFSPHGVSVKLIGGPGSTEGLFSAPWGSAVDGKGQIVVCCQTNHRFQVFSSDGQFIMQMGSQGPAEGQMNQPAAVAIDKEGRIILVDCGNHRVQIFS